MYGVPQRLSRPEQGCEAIADATRYCLTALASWVKPMSEEDTEQLDEAERVRQSKRRKCNADKFEDKAPPVRMEGPGCPHAAGLRCSAGVALYDARRDEHA